MCGGPLGGELKYDSRPDVSLSWLRLRGLITSLAADTPTPSPLPRHTAPRFTAPSPHHGWVVGACGSGGVGVFEYVSLKHWKMDDQPFYCY